MSGFVIGIFVALAAIAIVGGALYFVAARLTAQNFTRQRM